MKKSTKHIGTGIIVTQKKDDHEMFDRLWNEHMKRVKLKIDWNDVLLNPIIEEGLALEEKNEVIRWV